MGLRDGMERRLGRAGRPASRGRAPVTDPRRPHAAPPPAAATSTPNRRRARSRQGHVDYRRIETTRILPQREVFKGLTRIFNLIDTELGREHGNRS